jgi:glutamyl-tRNA synthetase
VGIVRTRFAPTPSGYLHAGNCANALLVAWLAGSDGTVVLRVDDIDVPRYRREYAEDIFATLAWLEVIATEGPRSPEELENRYSQTLRIDRYRQVADEAMDRGLLYACSCSRSTPVCGCRETSLVHEPGRTALRLRGTADDGSGPGIVIWRRDDIPAHHLTSVVDDHDLGITHVVRGQDLSQSTALQARLARDLGLSFPADVRHHPLALGDGGDKLSKSTADSGPLTRSPALRQRIVDLAAAWAPAIGITRP